MWLLDKGLNFCILKIKAFSSKIGSVPSYRYSNRLQKHLPLFLSLSVMRFLSRYLKGCVEVSWNENFSKTGWSGVYKLVRQEEICFLMQIGKLWYWWQKLLFELYHVLPCPEEIEIIPAVFHHLSISVSLLPFPPQFLLPFPYPKSSGFCGPFAIDSHW